MRKLIVNIVMLGALLAGFWVAGMVGNPDLDADVAVWGRIIAVLLGGFAVVGIGAIWGDLGDLGKDIDFKGRLRRMRGKGKGH